MDLDDHIDKAITTAKTIKRLSDVAFDNTSDGDEFIGLNEVSSTSSDDSEDIEDLKENYKDLQKQMRALQKTLGGDGKKRIRGGKKSIKDAQTYASGLRPDWNTCTTSISLKKNSHLVNISNGGLNDEDTDDVNPYHAWNDKHQKASRKIVEDRKHHQKTQAPLIAIVSGPEEEIAPIKLKDRPSKFSDRKTTTTTTLKIKAESENEENLMWKKSGGTTRKVVAKKRYVIHSNNVRINNLLDFAKDQMWRKIFLPTLYDRFFTSSNPFSQFAKGSKEFISLLQFIIMEVYPDVDYKVSASDPIHALAYNRINEKRSTIGSSTVNVIKKHVDTLDKAKPDAAHHWLLWASRGDGPLFFKEPVALDAPLDRMNPNYVKPGGKLLSTFIIDLITPLLHLSAGSISSNGHPSGLVALIMAALEHVVQILLQPSNDVAEFSHGAWESKVAIYSKTLENIEETCWKELLDECSTGGSSVPDHVDEEYKVNMSFLDHNHVMLFDFSSPAKS